MDSPLLQPLHGPAETGPLVIPQATRDRLWTLSSDADLLEDQAGSANRWLIAEAITSLLAGPPKVSQRELAKALALPAFSQPNLSTYARAQETRPRFPDLTFSEVSALLRVNEELWPDILATHATSGGSIRSAVEWWEHLRRPEGPELPTNCPAPKTPVERQEAAQDAVEGKGLMGMPLTPDHLVFLLENRQFTDAPKNLQEYAERLDALVLRLQAHAEEVRQWVAEGWDGPPADYIPPAPPALDGLDIIWDPPSHYPEGWNDPQPPPF